MKHRHPLAAAWVVLGVAVLLATVSCADQRQGGMVAQAPPAPGERIISPGPTASPRPEAGSGAPQIIVNGEAVQFPVAARLERGHLVAPARPFLERLGARVQWNPWKRECLARLGDRSLRLRCGQRRAFLDGRVIMLSVAPFVSEGYVYGPVGALAGAFGAGVRWDPERNVAEVTRPAGVSGPVAPGISKEAAVETATQYLKGLDQYPDTVTGVEAHRGQAPANKYWEALASGGKIASDAPARACWIVQFNYRGLVPDAWKQVYVDEARGEVIGGQQTR
jgi:hypothetical protein